MNKLKKEVTTMPGIRFLRPSLPVLFLFIMPTAVSAQVEVSSVQWTTAQTFKKQGFKIFILSGRLDNSKDVTIKWLKYWNVPFDKLQMRPDNKKDKFTPDDVLKQNWLNDLDKKDILCVFDDRQKVVDMWRANGIPCFQVAPGNF